MTDGREFPYRSFEIGDFLKQPKKSLVEKPEPKAHGPGLQMSLRLYLVDEKVFVPMMLHLRAGRKEIPASYRAAFLLANERVRGVDYSEIETKRFYKTHIPKGWHQNIIDPGLPANDPNQNRHDPLDWTVTDFDDFIRQTCKLWNIDLGREEGLL
jgi:hypothetical protein